MIDENYHIPDIDEDAIPIIVESSSVEDSSNRDEQVKNTISVIFEGNHNSKKNTGGFFDDKEDFSFEDSSFAFESTIIDDGLIFDDEVIGEKSNTVRKNFWLRFIERIFLKSYINGPNTVIFTIAGIIFGILMLWIGFLKALSIYLVIFIGNIIGQFLDANPRLMRFIDFVMKRGEK